MFKQPILDTHLGHTSMDGSNYSNITSLESDGKFYRSNTTNSNDNAFIDFFQSNQMNCQHMDNFNTFYLTLD